MACGKDDSTEKNFWRTPKLLEKLVRFLDGPSTKVLAQCHGFALAVLQQAPVWKKFIKRTCPDSKNDKNHAERGTLLATYRDKLMPTLTVLGMAKGAHAMKTDLLEVLCERFPPNPEENRILTDTGEYWQQKVDVIFFCSNQDHSVTESVSPLGFLLLDQVDLAVGSSPQMKVDKVEIQELADRPGWPLLSVLSKRVSCQQDQPEVVQVDTATSRNAKEAKAFSKIAQCCKNTFYENLDVRGKIGRQGWKALGKAAELHSPMLGKRRSANTGSDDNDLDFDFEFETFNVTSTREAMIGAKKEDLRKIWDGMGRRFMSGNNWLVTRDWSGLGSEIFHKEEGEKEWERLLEVLDMSKKEWDAMWDARFAPILGGSGRGSGNGKKRGKVRGNGRAKE